MYPFVKSRSINERESLKGSFSSTNNLLRTSRFLREPISRRKSISLCSGAHGVGETLDYPGGVHLHLAAVCAQRLSSTRKLFPVGENVARRKQVERKREVGRTRERVPSLHVDANPGNVIGARLMSQHDSQLRSHFSWIFPQTVKLREDRWQ